MKPSGISICVIADDLTGAMDAVAPFARRGVVTRVVVSPEAIDRQVKKLANSAVVVSVNTETRHASPERARVDTGDAVRKLKRLQPTILFKKIDSTMRGHVIDESIAALYASGRRQAILTPALPAQGRTVKNGSVFVHGTALKDTAIGRDLRSPPPSAPIPELLRQTDANLEICTIFASGNLPPPAGAAHRVVVADCEVQSDVIALVRQAMERSEDMLIVGSAGMAEGLAELAFGSNSQTSHLLTVAPGLTVYVVGSRTPESARQTERLIGSHPEAVVLETKGGEAVSESELERLALSTDGSGLLVIRPGQPGEGEATLNSDQVAGALAESVARLVKRAPVSLLTMTGGDTALAVLRRLELEVIEVVGELQPGIVLGHVQLPERRLLVVTKAGGFGDDELFLNIEQFVRAAKPAK